jgi:hypothetical protein
MDDYTIDAQPWKSYRETIKEIYIEGITKIGSYAIYNMANLKTLILPSSINTISDNGIGNCETLEYVYHYSTSAPSSVGSGILSGCKTSTIYTYSSYSGSISGATIQKATDRCGSGVYSSC